MKDENLSLGERTNLNLNQKEREYISVELKAKTSISEIARKLGRDRRTVQREIKRGMKQNYVAGKPTSYVYCPRHSQRRADFRATAKGRPIKFGNDKHGANRIANLIKKKGYSPEAAIAMARSEGSLKAQFTARTYYNWIYWGYVSVEKSDLPMEGKRRAKSRKNYRYANNDKERPSIVDRPKEVKEKIEFGHWEGDLIVGPTGTPGAIFTLVERKTRYGITIKFPSKHSDHFVKLIDHLERLFPAHFSKIFKTITLDNGVEWAQWREVEVPCGRDPTDKRIAVYFAHPYRSTDRAINENWNRFLRRKIPKGTIIEDLDGKDISAATTWVNTYPRGIFNFKSSKEVFDCEIELLRAA